MRPIPTRWKIMGGLIALWLILYGGSVLLARLRVAAIEKNWPTYQKQELFYYAEAIQKKFSRLERISYAVLDELIQHTGIGQELAGGKGAESRTRLFKQLLEFPMRGSDYQRGVAVYNSKKQCLAWRDWVFNLPSPVLDRVLDGHRFSAITYSEEKVYRVLCTFVPVVSPDKKQPVGVAVAFLPLDVNYPLSTRYIKSRSFAKEMAEELQLPEVQLNLDSSPGPPPADSLEAPLLSLNQEELGRIIVKVRSLELVVGRIHTQTRWWQNVITAWFFFLWFGACLYELAHRSWPMALKCLLSLALIWLTRKYFLVALDVAALLFPKIFQDPETFYCLALGEDLSGSLANLMLTATALCCSGWLWFAWMPTMPAGKTKGRRYALFVGQFTLAALFIMASHHLLCVWIAAFVQHCSIPLFNFIEPLPSWPILSLYWVILILGITLVLLYAWIIRYFLILPTALAFGVTLALFVLAAGWESQILGDHRPTTFFSLAFFGTAAASCLWRPPRRYWIALLLTMGLSASATYPIVYQAARQKLRATIEYRTYKDRQYVVQDTLESSLEIFSHDPRIVQAIADKKRNVAFLLWANSPLSTQGLDNVELWVYAKAKDYSQAQQDSLSPHRIIAADREKIFYLLSDFSLNMPTSQWYYPLISKLDTTKRQILQNVPGYGAEGRNTFFWLASVPIYSSQGEHIGFVAILSRYQVMNLRTVLPEIFLPQLSIQSQWEALLPWSMAYFEGQTMLDTNNTELAKDFRPLPQITELIENRQGQPKRIWVEEKIEGNVYDNLYFPLSIQKEIETPDGKQQIAEVKTGMIGYILPSWLQRSFYFIEFLLTGIFSLLVLVWCYPAGKFLLVWSYQWCRGNQTRLLGPFSYEQKILAAFLLISGIPVFVMANLSKDKAVSQIWESYKKSLTEYLENSEKALREECFIPFAPEEYSDNSMGEYSYFCQKWGERNSRMLNFYLGEHLCATNRPELFQTELLSLRISGQACYNLMLLKRDIYITLESLADYTFVVGYKALTSPQDKRQAVGALAIPMIYQQAEVQRKISEMITTIFTIYVAIFLLVIVIGIFLAHQITRPLAKMIEGTHRVSAGDLDFELTSQSNDEFSELVSSFNRMTKDLKGSREKLIQAQKDVAWREMARQIAHEIKNPLTPMKLSAQHIYRAYCDRSDKFSTILEKGIASIIHAIDSLSCTASSFSEFAKFIKPSLALHPLPPIIEECHTLFSHYHEQKITFEARIAPALPLVYTDPYHLKRVLINVITNAIQALEKEGNIYLDCYFSPELSMVTITIRDTGCGIPDHIMPRLFEPNFSTKTHGSGLGLAICKHAMDQMGGQIAIASKEGQGTTVTIQLPAPARE